MTAERSTMVLELTNLIAQRMNDGGRDVDRGYISTLAIEAAADDIVEAGWRPTKPYVFMRDAVPTPTTPRVYIHPLDRWLPDGWPVPRVGDQIGSGNWVSRVIWGAEKITVITDQKWPARGCCG